MRGKRAVFGGLALLVALAVLCVSAWRFWPVPTVSGAMPQEAYLWQRQWTPNVRAAALGAHEQSFAGMCVFCAEISPPGEGAGKDAGMRKEEPPAVRRATGLDWALLARCPGPVGLAVRVREFPGEVNIQRESFMALRGLVEELRRNARAAGLKPSEIQIDFDCATARLRGFAGWMTELRRLFPEETFCFTALPAWLRSRDFAALARASGGYILQVHWMARPGPDGLPPATLCDPGQARLAAVRAARLGVPFRVALPTYGYRLVLDETGKLLLATAETSSFEAAQPPPGGSVRALMADPAAMAGLVRDWTARRPAALRGIIWYRLPVAGERLNWPPRTLSAVMAGRVPQGRLALGFSPTAAGGEEGAVCELRLRNDGDADAALPGAIDVRCAVAPEAADAVGGFALEPGAVSSRTLVFRPQARSGAPPRVLSPGESLRFGWVRLEKAAGAVETRVSGSLR